jgi:hypothetical protein
MVNFEKDEIVSIRHVGKRETVDILVSGDNLFVADGILTHNCGFNTANPGIENIAESISVAQTSDCIWSIFQSEEDLELKLIKLGLMKNRFGARGMIQAMKIDYSTLTVYQSEESEEMMNDDEISLLESLTS